MNFLGPPELLKSCQQTAYGQEWGTDSTHTDEESGTLQYTLEEVGMTEEVSKLSELQGSPESTGCHLPQMNFKTAFREPWLSVLWTRSQLKTVFRELWLSVLWTRSVLLQRLQDHFSEVGAQFSKAKRTDEDSLQRTVAQRAFEAQDSTTSARRIKGFREAGAHCSMHYMYRRNTATCLRSHVLEVVSTPGKTEKRTVLFRMLKVTITTVSLASPSEDSEGTTFDHLVTLGQRRAK
ncbi:hypothetical protein Bbelb_360620 [Branchiostoma belcheri]|nr:hypothetical protein Bbelb_360620 [Branchiostoma belcheri]